MIRTALALMIAASLVGATAFLLLARDIYVVESGSMSATLRPGDAVVVKPLDGPVHPGQVITFEVQGKLITHRVTRVGDDGVRVKGDALDEEDPWTIPPDAVRGEMDFRIPYAGYLVVFLRQPAGWLSLVVLPALLIFGAEARRVARRHGRARKTAFTAARPHRPPASTHPPRPVSKAALLGTVITVFAVFASLAAALYAVDIASASRSTKGESQVTTAAPAHKTARGRRRAGVAARSLGPPSATRPSVIHGWATLLLALAATLATCAALAAALFGGGVLGFFSDTADESLVITTGTFGPVPATVDIHPDTLNIKSYGRWVTAYIELPQGHNVGNIDLSTVRLCIGEVTACPDDASVPAREDPSSVGDHDHDDISDRMVKFDRHELIVLLAGQSGDVTLTVAGLVSPPGEPFAGSDTIRVIDHGCCDGAPDALCEDKEAEEEALEATPTPEATGTPEATPIHEAAVAECTGTPEASPTAEPTAGAPAPEPPAAAAETLPIASDAPGPAPTTPPPDVPTVEYTVRAGESLSDVAAFFGTTVQTVVALNGVANANLVVPGQVLLVPPPPANTAPGQAFMSEYVVQPGETLTDIAARFSTTVEALAAENGLANPSAIRFGDRLLVP
jgi:signal peptidase I